LAEERKGADTGGGLAGIGRYSGFGLTWALAVLLFGGVGLWLDSKLGTEPIFLIAGSFLGAGAGFYYLYYHLVIEPRQRSAGDEGDGK
jgi:F0F1-type ATP synthase assembly protein I